MNHIFFDAIYSGDLAMVRRELELGVSPHLCNNLGESALLYAASHGRDDIVGVLLDYGATVPPFPMVEAAVSGDPAVLRRFLAMGADPNQADADGGTALMEAAGWGHRKLVEILLAAGADPRLSVNGFTAADCARAGDKPEATLDLLL